MNDAQNYWKIIFHVCCDFYTQSLPVSTFLFNSILSQSRTNNMPIHQTYKTFSFVPFNNNTKYIFLLYNVKVSAEFAPWETGLSAVVSRNNTRENPALPTGSWLSISLDHSRTPANFYFLRKVRNDSEYCKCKT